jgi:osmotically-inducible protein OsmY
MTKHLRNALILSLILLQGCAITGPVSEDLGKRTLGTKLDDQGIKSRGKANIKSASEQLDKAHVNITAFNGVVLLTGQVPSEEAKNLAVRSIEDLRKVKLIHNELEVAGPISFMARTNDSLLTMKVKTAMIFDENTDANRIKVVTENGVVYLMGLLTRNEADAAVTTARGVFGVQKIVKVFEYTN